MKTEAEQHGLAHIVSDDLARYIAFAHLSGIEQSVDGNHVKVRLVANNNTLDIICEKEDAFKISTSHGDFHDVLTKKEMARHVLKWLGR